MGRSLVAGKFAAKASRRRGSHCRCWSSVPKRIKSSPGPSEFGTITVTAAVTERLHVKHLHATVLHQLGVDPNRLSYFYNGLDQTLVGVEGAEPIEQIIG